MNIETNNIEGNHIATRSIEPKAPRNNRMRPLIALRALKNLINDPEKTDQVFVVINAMSGTSLEKTFVRFRKTEMGKKILSENVKVCEATTLEPWVMPIWVSSSENRSARMVWWTRAS